MSKADKPLSAKAEKSGVSVATLRKVYRRGVAAWNSGHRPGTTPQQWGHARVNSYINKGKTYHTADKDLRNESLNINTLFEMQLVGTDEYRRHAIAMTPGQDQEIEDAFPVTSPNKSPIAVPAKAGEPIVPQYEGEHDCGCESDCECDKMSESAGSGYSRSPSISFRGFRRNLQEIALSQAQAESQAEDEEKGEEDDEEGGEEEALELLAQLAAQKDDEEEEGENDGVNDGVDFMPTLKRRKPDNKRTAPSTMSIRPTLDGLPVTTQFATYEEKQYKGFMPTPRQVPAPPKGHPVPPGYMRVKSWGGGWELRKIPDWQYQKSVIRIGQTGHDEKLKKALGLKEAIEYHVENNISLTENIFRPGSEMFFEMINEAKKLYKEDAYEPKDEYERDLLESDIGELAEYNGQTVVLDYPIEEGLEECWKGYAQQGMKKKGDKMVPNCVPVNEEEQIKEDRAWTHEDEYYMHMDRHDDAMAAGNYEKAEIHAKKAEAAAAKHFKTTGEKIRDAGYTGKSTHIIKEEDETGGKGIGKPFRSGSGAAVYVRNSKGNVIKVKFSQSGMKKRYNEPARVRSFVARHHCLTNKDKTSRSYWACRWPRYFSNSGQQWW